MEILTYDVKKKMRVVAGTLENGVFTKRVNSSHYMRIVQGYGIQEEVINVLKKNGCIDIVIVRGKTKLKSKLIDWLLPEIRTINFGHGVQRFMPERYMTNELTKVDDGNNEKQKEEEQKARKKIVKYNQQDFFNG